MSSSIFDKIKQTLGDAKVEYKLSHHDPTYTSADASRIRGVAMHAGAKALVLRGNKSKEHWLFVMPADLRLSSKKVVAMVGEKVSFASDPVTVTGCVPGSVPPFGSLLGLKTFMDKRLAENDVIHFNAGSLTDSVEMKYADYLAIEKPAIVDITE